MKVLITGGAGFIGANLVERLEQHGHQSVVLDTLSPQIHGPDPRRQSALFARIDGKAIFFHGSVTDPKVVAQALAGCDAVVHLAAETGTGQSMYEMVRYSDVNVVGTAILLEALSAEPAVGKVVVASSRAVYGEGKYLLDGRPVYPRARREEDMARGQYEPIDIASGRPLELVATDETSALQPNSIYGITKQAQEQMVLLACAARGIGAVALRFQNVYGPGQSLANPYTGILSIFSTRILNGKEIDIYEDGEESRDFVFIDDVIDAIYRSLTSDAANGAAIGIGAGVPTSVLTVATSLVAIYGIDVPVRVTGAYRVGDIRHNYADPALAEQLLGFAAKTDFADGLRQFADWVQTQPRIADSYDASVAQLKARGLYK